MILVEQVSSAFGDIKVLRSEAGGLVYAQDECAQSEVDARGISLAAYIHALYGLALQSGAARVLMIGCGGGSLARLLHEAGVAVTVVDVNPAAFDVARRHFGLPDAVACLAADGHDFLLGCPDRHDAIVLDAYAGDRIPAHLAAVPFLELARTRLTERGCLLANAHVRHDLDPAADRLAAAMQAAFPCVRVLDGMGLPDRNAIVMAGAVAALEPPALLRAPSQGADAIAAALARLRFRQVRARLAGA